MSIARRDDNMAAVVDVQGYVESGAGGGGFRHIISILFKWKWLIVASLVAVVLPVAIFTTEAPTSYRSTAKLMVKRERAYLAVSESDLTRVSNFRQSTVEFINSEMQIIRSRDVIKQALNRLQLQKPVESVSNTLAMYPVRDSSVINLSYTSLDPDEPVRLLNSIVDAYLVKHADIHNPQGVLSFIENQVATYRQRSLDAVRRMHEFEKEMGIVDTQAELAAMVGQLSQLRTSRSEVGIVTRELQQQIAFLTEELAKQPKTLSIQPVSVPNSVFNSLTQRLVDLDLERMRLLERHRDQHPRVLRNQLEREAMQTRLAALEPWQGRPSSQDNPLYRDLQRQRLASQRQLTAAVEKNQALDTLIADLQASLQALNLKKFEYQRLVEEVKSRQGKYYLYQRKLEEARISEAMDREKLLNVGVIERAANPAFVITGKERGTLNLLLATFAGLAVGICTTLGIEFFSGSVATESELEKYLELPVLAAIERFPSKS